MSDAQFVAIMVGFLVMITVNTLTTLAALLLNDMRPRDMMRVLGAEIRLLRAEICKSLRQLHAGF